MPALPIRTDVSAADLRQRARREPDGRASRRMLAIANALDGMNREVAARAAGMDRQTLRDWVSVAVDVALRRLDRTMARELLDIAERPAGPVDEPCGPGHEGSPPRMRRAAVEGCLATSPREPVDD